jgi:uncharacterized protein (DUF433 family)
MTGLHWARRAILSIMHPIWTDPEIMSGRPCFAGTRVPIKNLFDYIERDYSIEEFVEHFPSVTRAQVIAVLQLAQRGLAAEPAPAEAPAA